MSFETIEERTETYARLRDALAAEVAALERGYAQLKARRLPEIKRLASQCADAKGLLAAEIDGNHGLFEKPRTRIFAGIRVGLQKGKGRLVWADADAVVARIKQLFPGDVDRFVKVTETPRRDALEALDVKDLARVGVDVDGTGDRVVVKPQDSEIDKLVDALLGEAEPAQETGDAA